MSITRLAIALSDLYSSEADARRIAADSGIPHHNLSGDTGLQIWFSLLEEAARRGKVLSLVSVVRDDYPNNAEFLEAADRYLEDQTRRGRESEKLLVSDDRHSIYESIAKLKDRVLILELEIRHIKERFDARSGFDSTTILVACLAGLLIAIFTWFVRGGF